MSKNILITGATGLIGTNLVMKLTEIGKKVSVISRSKSNAENYFTSSIESADWKDEIGIKKLVENSDSIVHLAGENVMSKRWSDTHKKKIYDSRINTTRKLVDIIKSSEVKPKTFICASAIGYYGNGVNNEFTEDSPPGEDFLAKVTKDWENEAAAVKEAGVRHVSIRTGIVLSADGGALSRMITPFKFFIGGPLGSGKQCFPWIHIDDLIQLFIFAIENENVSGALNGVSPGIVSMKDFCKTMGKIMNRPSFLSVPSIVLKLLFGEGADSILSGNKIIPFKTLASGFQFKFSDSSSALKNLLKN